MKICALCKEEAKKLHYSSPDRGVCKECFILERDHPYRFVYPPVMIPAPFPPTVPWVPPIYGNDLRWATC